MIPLPPELDELKNEWVGPVRVPGDLPDHFVEKSGVYIWVRRYTERPEIGSGLRGLVIYVGSDKQTAQRPGLPSRMFDHLVQLLGGGQSMWDESGAVISGADRRDVFKRYRDDFSALMSTTIAEFRRSEYFYVPCGDPGRVEDATYMHIRNRMVRTWKHDPIWLAVFRGSPPISTRQKGLENTAPIVASELDGRGLLRWLGLIP